MLGTYQMTPDLTSHSFLLEADHVLWQMDAQSMDSSDRARDIPVGMVSRALYNVCTQPSMTCNPVI